MSCASSKNDRLSVCPHSIVNRINGLPVSRTCRWKQLDGSNTFKVDQPYTIYTEAVNELALVKSEPMVFETKYLGKYYMTSRRNVYLDAHTSKTTWNFLHIGPIVVLSSNFQHVTEGRILQKSWQLKSFGNFRKWRRYKLT